MIAFPNCKINLGLAITRKRADGYHDLETFFYPVALTDVLEIIPVTHNASAGPMEKDEQIACTLHGLPVPGNLHDNICVKAFHLLKKAFPDLPPVHIHLYKAIPMGAGLGGGSADGAFMLTLLNDGFHLGLSTQQLLEYALQLGSDCPFFIINKPCYATGRGELLEEIPVDLSGYTIVLVNPGIHINTGWAFAQLALQGPTTASPEMYPVREIVQQPVATWRHTLSNDFEAPAGKKHPEIIQIKDELYRHGAVYASMTGSGSTVFGLFKKPEKPSLSFPGHYRVIIV